jgi:poly-gamma-glutamate capsule biosynthesis protein CapA/YwtB (metallophosphatase superfamily)
VADFGSEALADSISHLEANHIVTIGVGETLEQAYAPRIFKTRDGRTIAVIALIDLENDPGAGAISVATAADRDRVERAIAEAHARAQFVLCLVHWGDENTPRVNERQRELARWLIDHGVEAVAGSHPHCFQPLDFYHGRPIVYSLGNLVFDGAPELASWNRGELLEVNIGHGGGDETSVRLVPVKLDARGFPRIAETENDQPHGKTPVTAGAAFSRNRVQGASKKR